MNERRGLGYRERHNRVRRDPRSERRHGASVYNRVSFVLGEDREKEVIVALCSRIPAMLNSS